MSKGTRSVVLFICLHFVASLICAADSLTEWERGIFAEIVQTWHEMLYALPRGSSASSKDIDNIHQQVARKYSITLAEVKRINTKGTETEPSEQDYLIYDEFLKQFEALPKSSTTDDVRRLHVAVANQFGISLARLHEIEYLMDEGLWGL